MGWCCRKGYYHTIVPLLPAYPQSFWNQLWVRSSESNTYSRKLNNVFAFSSLGVSGGFIPLAAPSNVAISGRVYHRLRDIGVGEHSMRWFLHDEDSRVQSARSQHIPMALFTSFQEYLRMVNPYMRHLQHAAALTTPQQPFALELRDTVAGGDVAAILHTDMGAAVEPRSVVIWRHGQRDSTPVNILSSQYEPLQYPVFFPHGTPGWQMKTYPRCSQIWWYRMRILREYRFKLFGRLLNEYVVDMYSRVEDERLMYLRDGRKKQYRKMKSVIDAVREHMLRADVPGQVTQDQGNPAHDGNCVVTEDNFLLPASFLGSKAWASEQVADSLAICTERGKPSLFITITTNPNWPEIQSQLLPGQTAADRPDVVDRAFRARMSHAIEQMKARFGRVAYVIRVVEFQKRGLPHNHMIVRFGMCLTSVCSKLLFDTGTAAKITNQNLRSLSIRLIK